MAYKTLKKGGEVTVVPESLVEHFRSFGWADDEAPASEPTKTQTVEDEAPKKATTRRKTTARKATSTTDAKKD